MIKAMAKGQDDKRKESDVMEGSVSAQATILPSAQRSAVVYDLGPLNRHWYRRCLDALDERLRESSSNPSIKDLKELCDAVITGFLTAITGQAPESPRLQFPADRAYFIPFEGDLAENFNFAKPFYRIAEEPGQGKKDSLSKHSIWSFYPWTEGDEGIEIDHRRSVDEKHRTIPFEEMISVRAQFVKEEAFRSGTKAQDVRDDFLLDKSLLVRGEDRSYPETVFALATSDTRREMYEACAEAILGIFDVYRMTPGNVAVEAILWNHLTVIRWLMAMLRPERDVQEGKVTPVAEQDEDFKKLFDAFLQYFFLGKPFGEDIAENEKKGIDGIAALLEPDGAKTASGGQEEGSDWTLYEELAGNAGTPFSSHVKKRERNSDRQDAHEGGTHYIFQEIVADLKSFRQYLLRAGSEERIERDLTEALGGDLLKAGEGRQSFVWVIPDFEVIDDSLPKDFEVQASTKQAVQALSGTITKAYKAFYQRFDVACVEIGGRRERLKAYWRTLGETNRQQLVFTSFDDYESGLYTPNIFHINRPNRPQNFFLRVKICDSLNEPVINGLFILSTDHDEVIFKGKQKALRKEDQEDLLAFAKVYFFIVRDYFRALDQAQEARDIGQLNQYLYDRRLTDLDLRMQRRIETPEFTRGSIAEEGNWAILTYEILNNYAFSLLEKLDDVQSETFPYDRLLILPLGAEMEDGEYQLPFYLFQAVFVERHLGEIQKGRYSLIKPFQSPIEEIETGEAADRFRVKSFQKVSMTGDKEVRLDRSLEKLYVSADEILTKAKDVVQQGKEATVRRATVSKAAEKPDSFVVKLLREGTDPERGRAWVAEAVSCFWSRFNPTNQAQRDLWLGFLNRLTETFEKLRLRDSTEREKAEEQWFLLRFGLLRVLLAGRTEEKDKHLREIRRAYDKDLRLRFNDNRSLDVLRWAKDPDSFGRLAELLPHLAEGTEIQFEPFALRGDDPFVLAFFRHLTNLVCNRYDKEDDREKGWTTRAQCTWYQPLLTRPLEEGGEVRGETLGVGKPNLKLEMHVDAGRQIKNRVPPYEQIEAGRHALSMFLGVVNFGVGQGKQRARLRCLIAMIRDYDDSQTGAGLPQKEREQQLEVDRRDLSLYTSTFFRNVQKFVKDALAREENRILSTDISQIARNWYSSGMDYISLQLRRGLDHLLEDRTNFRLGGLRPEIVDTFFSSMLDVLLRPEERPGTEGKEILLESFPFDRMLHIPLGLGPAEGARLCYARTRVVDVMVREGERGSWNALSARECYDRIRRSGRAWPQTNGRKKAEQVHHFGFADRTLMTSEDLAGLLERIGQPRLLDALVRSLYEANAIQTLAVAGLLLRLLGDRENGAMKERLEAVVADSIRSVEQQAGASAVRDIHTEVYMDREAILRQLSSKGYKGSDTDLRRDLQEIRFLPAWYEFFEAAERSEDFVYGLKSSQGEVVSKLFYVYYSIEAPRTFTEVTAMGSRFRGLFAFVVDDASTDVKSEVGEIADQQDIRTFVHNGVRSLQLILENQGLENRFRQPGIESFVLGILHRLKNELGKPMAVLHILKENSRSKEENEQIERATSAIESLKELFKSLRGLSEVQQGVVPIRSFSTHWLGWLFISKLAVAVRKAADELDLEPGQARAPIEALENIQKEAERELKAEPRDTLRSVDLIQRKLKELESRVSQLAAGRNSIRPDVVLSFQVFSEVPLEFLGSFHLEEALNILIENALQAFWEFLSPLSEQTPETGLLRMICRHSEERSGEILIEISNSSLPIDRSILEVLNDRVAQPMTRQQHSKSGKKGGSGFGHYYARRTIAELCGGREARRDLDVRIDYLEETSLARVQVNLIEASAQGLQPLSSEQIQTEVRRNFDTEFVLAAEAAGGSYYLPQNIDVRSLFNLIRRLLVADREALESRLLSWWRSRVCRMLSDRCDKVRAAVIKRLKALEATDPDGGERWQEILAQVEAPGVAQVRRSSFHDLRRFLYQVRDRPDGSLVQIAKNEELLGKLLKNFVSGSNGYELNPEYLIDGSDKEKIFKELDPYKPHLKASLRESLQVGEALKLLLEDLDQDERGRPVPTKDGVANILAPAQWIVNNGAPNGDLHLAISLVDGDLNKLAIDFTRSRLARQEIASDEYRLESQTFQTYSRAFDRAHSQGSPVGQLWLEVSREQPRRTVYLLLRKQETGSRGPARVMEAR